jgi:mono/diheme cytochrome c family protein
MKTMNWTNGRLMLAGAAILFSAPHLLANSLAHPRTNQPTFVSISSPEMSRRSTADMMNESKRGRFPGSPSEPQWLNPLAPAPRIGATPDLDWPQVDLAPASQATTSVPAQPAPVQSPLPPDSIVWDAESKEYDARPGETRATFTFWLTNVASSEVVIDRVRTSCGCTVAKLPSQPWRIPPGNSGPIQVTVHLSGKSGTITKPVTVDSNAGTKNLLVKVHIPTPPSQGNTQSSSSAVQMDRLRNMQLALADRQAPLQRAECAKCHVEPAVGKLGKELYATACAICHNAKHRATTVPDLQILPHPLPSEYWRTTVTLGKTNSMMPAFAKEHGGFLTPEQITSLVEYLVKDFPKEPKMVYHESPARAEKAPGYTSPEVNDAGTRVYENALWVEQATGLLRQATSRLPACRAPGRQVAAQNGLVARSTHFSRSRAEWFDVLLQRPECWQVCERCGSQRRGPSPLGFVWATSSQDAPGTHSDTPPGAAGSLTNRPDRANESQTGLIGFETAQLYNVE